MKRLIHQSINQSNEEEEGQTVTKLCWERSIKVIEVSITKKKKKQEKKEKKKK